MNERERRNAAHTPPPHLAIFRLDIPAACVDKLPGSTTPVRVLPNILIFREGPASVRGTVTRFLHLDAFSWSSSDPFSYDFFVQKPNLDLHILHDAGCNPGSS